LPRGGDHGRGPDLTPDDADAKKKGDRNPDKDPEREPVRDPWEPKHPLLPKPKNDEKTGDGEEVAWVSGPGVERSKGKKLALSPEELARMHGITDPVEENPKEEAPAKMSTKDAGPEERADIDRGDRYRKEAEGEETRDETVQKPEQGRDETPAPHRAGTSDRPAPDRRAVPTVPPSMKYRRKVNPKVSPMTIPTTMGGTMVKCPNCGAGVNTGLSSYCYKCGGSVV
jgi:hypothetical protein